MRLTRRGLTLHASSVAVLARLPLLLLHFELKQASLQLKLTRRNAVLRCSGQFDSPWIHTHGATENRA